MKTLKLNYPFIFLFVMLISCSSKETADKYFAGITPKDEVAKAADLAISDALASEEAVKANSSSDKKEKNDEKVLYSSPVVKIPEKIKKTAEINITVDDYKKARTEIETIIKAGNAYIGNEREQNSTYSISNDMVIRVANKDFDAMVNKLLTSASHINSKNISAEDVTAQFVDIQSRLNSKKEVEKRYLDILQKASKVSDILEIQEKLGEIREEIEAKEGELKYLADQVDYSTINLNFHQDFEYTPSETPGFFGRMGNAFGNGWNSFLSFLVGIVYAWPLWIILGLITYFVVKFIKRQIKK